MTSCVKETRVLHDLVMGGDGGPTDLSICNFTVPADVDDNCSAYFDPEPDLVVYIEIGCKIDSCL
jgi:hypothetical protein